MEPGHEREDREIGEAGGAYRACLVTQARQFRHYSPDRNKERTGRDEPTEFISFEDTSAFYETTFFPETYARFCHMLNRSQPYVLLGLVEEDFGAITLTVDSVQLL